MVLPDFSVNLVLLQNKNFFFLLKEEKIERDQKCNGWSWEQSVPSGEQRVWCLQRLLTLSAYLGIKCPLVASLGTGWAPAPPDAGRALQIGSHTYQPKG